MRAYRADIDGLRAIAVTSVVLYHAAPHLVPSGFVGVDIFFAISGYLIGGIVYSGVLDRSFSFVSFYARRARRILPALLAVVLVTLVAGYFLLDADAYKRLGSQSAAALLGISNIYFWQKQSYFAPEAEYEPMTMTWSLGVEEQFYLCFPFIIFALLRLPGKWRVPVLIGLAGLSFALSIHTLSRSPTAAFYLLPQRAWELAAGVILAILHAEGGLPALRRGQANALACLGLSLLAASIFLFDAQTPFPGWMALLPVFGTLFLIHARDSLINRKGLAFRPFVVIGLISYSWYLWHWPLMAYVRVVSDDGLVQGALLKTVVLSLGLAFLSWRFIEQPFRHRKLQNAAVLLRYGAVLAVSIALPAGVRVADGLSGRLPPAVLEASRVYDDGMNGHGHCLADLHQADLNTDPYCLPGGSGIAVFGDSHAEAASVGLSEFARQRGTTLAHFTKASCAPLLGFPRGKTKSMPQVASCGEFQDTALERILSDKAIETVYLVGYWPPEEEGRSRYWTYEDGIIGEAVSPSEAVRTGLGRMIDRLKAGGKNVVVVNDVPAFEFDALRHVVSDGMPARAVLRGTLEAGYEVDDGRLSLSNRIEAYDTIREIVAQTVRERPGVGLVDIRKQLCGDDKCRYVIDGKPLYLDSNHLSPVGSLMIDWAPMELARADSAPGSN